jgi:hypothetical protein
VKEGEKTQGGLIHFSSISQTSTLLVEGTEFKNIETKGYTGGAVSVEGTFASVGMIFNYFMYIFIFEYFPFF